MGCHVLSHEMQNDVSDSPHWESLYIIATLYYISLGGGRGAGDGASKFSMRCHAVAGMLPINATYQLQARRAIEPGVVVVLRGGG